MNTKWLIALGVMVIVALLLAAQVIGRQPEAPSTALQPQGESGSVEPERVEEKPSALSPQGHSEGSLEPEKVEEEPPALPKYNIVSLLPPDAIPAIDNPQFLSAEKADQQYDPEEPVLGVEINGDARAYSVPHLSGHEIVNDTVGGVPVAVTW
jgi:hypothetical protein